MAHDDCSSLCPGLMARGHLISFEGIDGAGKSDLIERFAEMLQRHELPVVIVQDPGTTELGNAVRALLLAPEADSFSGVGETLLYTAARVDTAVRVVRPALRHRSIVIADRWLDSTIAYQYWGAGVFPGLIRQSGEIEHIEPSLTFWIDTPVSLAIARARQRDNCSDGRRRRFEKRDHAFFERVVKGYEHIHRCDPERVKRIDGSQFLEQVHAEIVRTWLDWLARLEAHRLTLDALNDE